MELHKLCTLISSRHLSAKEGRREVMLILIADILKEVLQSSGLQRKGNKGEWPSSGLFKTNSRLQSLQSLLLRFSLPPFLLFSCPVLCAALWDPCPHFSLSSHHSDSSIQLSMSQTFASHRKSVLVQCELDHTVFSWQCRRKEPNKSGRPQKRSSFLTVALAPSAELWLTNGSWGAGKGLENTDVRLPVPCTKCRCNLPSLSRQQEIHVCVHWVSLALKNSVITLKGFYYVQNCH